MTRLVLIILVFLLFTAGAEASENRMEVIIGKHTFSAVLGEGETARALSSRLPLTFDMSDLNGNEKYHYLDKALPSAPEKVDKICAGDIMLYGDNCIVVFYNSFSTSYRYTQIGHIEDASALENAVGKGNITISFSLR